MTSNVYKTKGVCSESIAFIVDSNKVHKVTFIKGCDGNAKGISALVEGMEIAEVITRLEGIKCGNKETSCPDQLSRALKETIS